MSEDHNHNQTTSGWRKRQIAGTSMTQDEIIEAAIQGHSSKRDAIRWAINVAEIIKCLDCGSSNIGIPANYDSLINSVKAQPKAKLKEITHE